MNDSTTNDGTTPGDDELIDRLRRIAAEVDGPPASVIQAAQAALSTRRLDEELAELVMDSELASPAMVRTGHTAVRLLSFESAEVVIELQVQQLPAGMSVRGLVSGAVGPVVLETPVVRHSAELDDDGWFTVDRVAAGLVRIRLSTVGGSSVVGGWVSL